MTVSFFGHRVVTKDIQPVLRKILVYLFENCDADKFYVGNQGDFDRLVRKVLKELKGEYPQICYSVILAYMPVKNSGIDYGDILYSPRDLRRFILNMPYPTELSGW